MERKILKTLDWKLNPPTLLFYCQFYMAEWDNYVAPDSDMASILFLQDS
jgi:hypothetical protein